MPGEGVEQDGAVLRGPRHRAGGIQAGRQRDHAAARHQPWRRLQPGNAAVGGRQTDRATGVGTERPQHQPRRHRRAGPGTRTAGVAPDIPGIAGGRPGQVERRAANGKFMRGQLAQHHRAGFGQPAHRLGVLRRHIARQQLRVRRGGDPFSLVDILICDGYAEQRRLTPRRLRPPGRPCSRQRLPLGHRDERIQLRVQSGGAFQQGPGQLQRRDFPRGDQPAGLGDGEKGWWPFRLSAHRRRGARLRAGLPATLGATVRSGSGGGRRNTPA